MNDLAFKGDQGARSLVIRLGGSATRERYQIREFEAGDRKVDPPLAFGSVAPPGI